MKLALTLSATALLGGMLTISQPAQAQQTIDSLGLTITTTPLVATDYVFRGISQTRERPTAQLTVDAEHSSGIYVGAFVSNANFAGTNIRQEVDLNLGYRFAIGDLKLDIGGTYFGYPGYDKPPGGFEAAWYEVALRASYELAPFKFVGQIAYSPNFNFESGNAVYVEGGFDLTLDFGFTGSFRAGYQWIDRNFNNTGRNEGSFGAPDYAVFSVGVSREIAYSVIASGAVYYNTLRRDDCFGGAGLCGLRAVAALSRPF
jgi:uncharacterized protein (TIGR02001 family)